MDLPVCVCVCVCVRVFWGISVPRPSLSLSSLLWSRLLFWSRPPSVNTAHMERWILGDISAARNFNYSLRVMWPTHWHVVIWWFHTMVTHTHTHAHVNLDRSASTDARKLTHWINTRAVFSLPRLWHTLLWDVCFFKQTHTHTHTHSRWYWKKQRNPTHVCDGSKSDFSNI